MVSRRAAAPLLVAALVLPAVACDGGDEATTTRFDALPAPVDARLSVADGFAPEAVAQIAGLPGIAAAEGMSTAYSVTARHARTGREREAIVVTALAGDELRTLEVVSGAYPAAPGEALLDDATATALGWTAGDRLVLSRGDSTLEVVVTGLCGRPAAEEFGGGELVVAVPLSGLFTITGADRAEDVAVRLATPESARTLHESVDTSLGRPVAVTFDDDLRGVLD